MGTADVSGIVAIRPQAGLSYPKAFGGLFVEGLADGDLHFVLRDSNRPIQTMSGK